MRLDIFLFNTGICKSRNVAKHCIKSGFVTVNGIVNTRPNADVCDFDIVLCNYTPPYVSRGGEKLHHAIIEFGLDFDNKTVLDIGASTGGFTDCVLQHGAKKVISIDVGSGQLAPSLLADDRVTNIENTDIRDLTIAEHIDIAVSDISFISVLKVAPYIQKMNIEELVILIKPQFEIGKTLAKRYKGIVKSPKDHIKVIKDVLHGMREYGYHIHSLTYSPIKGGSGNIEYLAYFTTIMTKKYIDIEHIVSQSHEI